MDIEKLKKVNQLATTLRSQGLASGRDEAANLAGQMSWQEEDNVDHIFKEESQPEQISIGEEKMDEQNQVKKEAMYDEQRMIEVLQKFADQFSSEIKKINEKVNEQEETIRQIAQRVVTMSEESSSGDKKTEEAKPSQQQLNTEQQEQKTEEKPRSGDYNSNDVSIEEFFYFGQK